MVVCRSLLALLVCGCSGAAALPPEFPPKQWETPERSVEELEAVDVRIGDQRWTSVFGGSDAEKTAALITLTAGEELPFTATLTVPESEVSVVTRDGSPAYKDADTDWILLCEPLLLWQTRDPDDPDGDPKMKADYVKFRPAKEATNGRRAAKANEPLKVPDIPGIYLVRINVLGAEKESTPGTKAPMAFQGYCRVIAADDAESR